MALIRIGVVLGKDGGALGAYSRRSHKLMKYVREGLRFATDHAKFFLCIVAMMVPFFQMFAGGPLGSGQQW